MSYKDVKTFISGMDADSDDRIIQKTRYMLNCRVGTSENSNVGAVENVKGTTLVTYTLPSGVNKCIGSCEDLEGNSIIFFVSNTSGFDSILRYNIKLNTIECILQWLNNPSWRVRLGFNPDHYITSCYVIKGLLYWNDDINPPRKINIDKAYKFMQSGGSDPLGYAYINEQVIDKIKHPPKFSPTCSYQNDPTYSYNNLRGSTFQFAYSYIYDDNEKSVQSPITKLPIPYNEEALDGQYINNIRYNNVIDIIVNSGEYTIKSILIFGRGNTTDNTGTNPVTVSANNANWFLIDRIEKYDTQGNVLIPSITLYTYKFYNNKIKDIVDQTDAARLFDFIPQLQGASELIEKNRTIDGDITEGYDNVDIDVNLTPYQVVTSYLTTTYNLVSGLTSYGASHGATIGMNTSLTLMSSPILQYGLWYINIPPIGTISAGDIINVKLSYIIDTESPPQPTHTQDYQIIIGGDDLSDFPNSLRIKIGYVLSNDLCILLADDYPNAVFIATSWIDKDGKSRRPVIGAYPIVTGTRITTQSPRKTFKSGAYHEFGIVYSDRGLRSGAANVSSKTTVYVPFITETDNAGFAGQFGYNQNVMGWEVNHKPPIWATQYQWVYTKNTTISAFKQFYMKAVSHDVNGNVRIKFNEALTDYYAKSANKSILGTWVWQKGDRFRLLLKSTTINGQWQYRDNFHTSSIYYMPIMDYEITGYDSTQEFICENFDFSSWGTGYTGVIEVYRPAKELGERVFYEIGENYEIGDAGLPTRYHKGQNADQTTTTPATGVFESGDCYAKLRWTGLPTPFEYFPCESDHLSDFYISDSCDIGRPNVVDINMKRRTLIGNYRWGGKLVQNTQINDISKYVYADINQVPDKYGNIERLVEVGNVLKIIQHKKVSSLYIGLSSTGEADGTNSLYVIQTVIGTLRIPIDVCGSKHPESVLRWDRQLYFFDSIKGEAYRDAANGLFPISSYGKVKYFRDWRDKFKSAAKSSAISGWDNDKGEYVLTLYYETRTGLKEIDTIAFNEVLNEWKTNWSFTPEYYGFNGQVFLGFLSGRVFLHNSNIRHNYFYGVKYPQKVTFVCNPDYTLVKRFLALAYDSNKPWAAFIKIPVCDEYPIGMESRLLESKFRVKEGFYYAEFMQDLNTPNMPTAMEALINGRDLRGKTIEITLENWHDELTILFSAYVNMISSMLSGTK